MSEKGVNFEEVFQARAKHDFKLLAIILFLLFVNILTFISGFDAGVTGFAVSEGNGKFTISLAIFILQWVALIILVIIFYVRHLRKKNQKTIGVDFGEFEKLRKSKTGTDIDVLYSVLQIKKEVPLSVIQKVFNLPKQKALVWCKILEDHSLAIINYPAFSEPILKKK